MKNLTRRGAASTALGLAAASMLPAPRLARAADKVTWTFSLYGPPRAATLTFEHLAKVAKEKSGGNFTINLRYNEQLGEAKDFLDGIKVDSYQGAFVAFSYAPAKTPLQGVLDMPFLPIADLVAAAKVQDQYQAWQPVADELARWNSFHLMQSRGLEGYARPRSRRSRRRDETARCGADLGLGAGSLHRARARHVPGRLVPLHVQLYRLQAT
jgi:TRAP-type C4-dicarboxylate transport system substrate-binding protein